MLAIAGARGPSGPRLLASHRDCHAPVLDAADLGFVEPPISRRTPGGTKAYGDYCLRVCAERAVDLFVVQRGHAAMVARAAEFAAIGTRLAATADAETLALIEDKSRFHRAAVAAGVPMPWTVEINSVEAFDAARDTLAGLGLAACIKPPHGVFGAGFWRLDSEQGLFATLMDADAHVIDPDVVRAAVAAAAPGLRLLVLEYLGGDEWSLDCLCRDGRILAAVARRKLGRVQRLEVDGPIFAIARRAVEAFALSGLINLQFKAAREGDETDVRLLEINPRMSGGCLYTQPSGVNLPWLHVALELGLVDQCDIPDPVGGALVAAVGAAQVVSACSPAEEMADA